MRHKEPLQIHPSGTVPFDKLNGEVDIHRAWHIRDTIEFAVEWHHPASYEKRFFKESDR
ncbi:MAG: hypothetical protein GXY80_14605 [Syntrophorhabdus aromaticivorans]|uniref:Uncharacterized protein n=1 Tax=Syntrophorhabdus aromaticivorans TaxID=328301 RepID=A0A971M7P3_9BACT|nr:hypothetical protein [Syntrophorhabdus aromaticivorans]